MMPAQAQAKLDRLVAAGCVADCPGCAHRLLEKSASEAQKSRFLSDTLASWAAALRPLSGAGEAGRWGYRSRACLAAEQTGVGWRTGLRRRDRIIDISDCPVHGQRLRRCLSLLRASWPVDGAFALAWYVQNRAQITLVLKSAVRPDLSWLDAALTDALAGAGAEGLWLHLNPATGKRVFAKRDWELIWGRSRSRDSRGLWYGPTAFQQPLDELYDSALDLADDFLEVRPGDRVWDLYCGTGTSIRRWLGRGARVTGVELSGEAVECARENVPESRILRGTCGQRLPQLDQEIEASPDGERRLVFANPPRTGLEPEVLQWCLTRGRPERMAYLSCSAGTLARDLRGLEAGGYRVVALWPLDFFPQTYHVETLALLERAPAKQGPGSMGRGGAH